MLESLNYNLSPINLMYATGTRLGSRTPEYYRFLSARQRLVEQLGKFVDVRARVWASPVIPLNTVRVPPRVWSCCAVCTQCAPRDLAPRALRAVVRKLQGATARHGCPEILPHSVRGGRAGAMRSLLPSLQHPPHAPVRAPCVGQFALQGHAPHVKRVQTLPVQHAHRTKDKVEKARAASARRRTRQSLQPPQLQRPQQGGPASAPSPAPTNLHR